MEIASRRPLNFYKNQWYVSRYPESERIGKLVSLKELIDLDTIGLDRNWYDFLKSFEALRKSSNTPAVWQVAHCENSDYADMIHSWKNIYLSVISVYGCEDILYSFSTRENTKRVLSSIMVFESSEDIFQSAGIIGSKWVFYSKFVTNSNAIWFSSNMIWCTECIFCNWLTNQSYCIENIVYSKEEYSEKKKKLLSDKKLYDSHYYMLPVKWSCFWSTNVHWSFVIDSESVENGYYSYNIHKARNIFFLWWKNGNENAYDMFVWWAVQWNHMYATQWAWNSEQIYCSAIINDSSFLFYCVGCIWCSFCLWCTWLQNKSYCILNKQYTKEDRYIKVDEIFWAMHADWTLWEFFPASMNPFYFNDTAAYLIDPSFTKEEVAAKWYLRRDEPIKVDIPAWVQTVSVKDLDKYEGWKPKSVIARNGAERNDEAISNTDRHASLAMTQWNQIASSPSQDSKAPRNDVTGWQQWYIDDEILKKVIIDEQGNAYRIIPMELEFLRKYELPLPRKHWLDRMKENFRIS
jgi:hypothetical protein